MNSDQQILDYLRENLEEPELTFEDPFEELVNASRCNLYSFSLAGFSKRPELEHTQWICKVHRLGEDKTQKESLVTAAIHDLGYPAPEILTSAPAGRCLPTGMFVMQYLPGRNPSELGVLIVGLWIVLALFPDSLVPPPVPLIVGLAGILTMSTMYAHTWLRLHTLDLAMFRSAVGKADNSNVVPEFNEGWIQQLEQRAFNANAQNLEPAFAWLKRNLPDQAVSKVLCHGDFHYWNVRCSPHITGVLDWEEAIIAPREFDLSWFRVVNHWMDIPAFKENIVSATIAWCFHLAFTLQNKIIELLYRVSNPTDEKLMRYFSVVHALRGLVAMAEEEARGEPWGARTMRERLLKKLPARTDDLGQD